MQWTKQQSFFLIFSYTPTFSPKIAIKPVKVHGSQHPSWIPELSLGHKSDQGVFSSAVHWPQSHCKVSEVQSILYIDSSWVNRWTVVHVKAGIKWSCQPKSHRTLQIPYSMPNEQKIQCWPQKRNKEKSQCWFCGPTGQETGEEWELWLVPSFSALCMCPENCFLPNGFIHCVHKSFLPKVCNMCDLRFSVDKINLKESDSDKHRWHWLCCPAHMIKNQFLVMIHATSTTSSVVLSVHATFTWSCDNEWTSVVLPFVCRIVPNSDQKRRLWRFLFAERRGSFLRMIILNHSDITSRVMSRSLLRKSFFSSLFYKIKRKEPWWGSLKPVNRNFGFMSNLYHFVGPF